MVESRTSQSQIIIERCPECRSIELVHDSTLAETICNDCGLVIREKEMDRGPEWRAFTVDEKKKRARTGSPSNILIHDKGLSTVIKPYDRDAYNKGIPLSKKAQIYRISKLQTRARVSLSNERSLSRAMTHLGLISSKLINIPRFVEEEASLIFRKASEKGLVRGRSVRAITAASFYAACRLHGNPRSLDDLAQASLVSRKDIARCYRLLLRELKLQMPIDNPLIYLPKIATELRISQRTQTLAAKIVTKIKSKRAGIILGKGPVGMAAAVLYIAGKLNNEPITQREAASVAEVTEVTVRNRYRELNEKLEFKCYF